MFKKLLLVFGLTCVLALASFTPSEFQVAGDEDISGVFSVSEANI